MDFSVGLIVSSGDEINNVLDLSLNKTNKMETSRKARDLAEIFSQSISKNTVSSVSPGKKTGIGTCLKHHDYGEVLITDEVLERLKKAEENKKTKKTSKRKIAKKSESPGKSDVQKKLKESTNKQRQLEDKSESEEE